MDCCCQMLAFMQLASPRWFVTSNRMCCSCLHPTGFRGGMQKSNKRFVSSQPIRCHKMYVPGFGEASPEAKAAMSLQNFFNYVAVRIVLAQLEMVDEANTKLMRDYVLETSHIEDAK